mmetsp:Transcript_89447/g.148685  ORF Transcript_89447/g.148685 Transcript_89447/m.148685 type:complete len:206 (+) Transcript_89447:515-1132(+)
MVYCEPSRVMLPPSNVMSVPPVLELLNVYTVSGNDPVKGSVKVIATADTTAPASVRRSICSTTRGSTPSGEVRPSAVRVVAAGTYDSITAFVAEVPKSVTVTVGAPLGPVMACETPLETGVHTRVTLLSSTVSVWVMAAAIDARSVALRPSTKPSVPPCDPYLPDWYVSSSWSVRPLSVGHWVASARQSTRDWAVLLPFSRAPWT